mmetsp:Transcript_14763/g.35160  ORF Transcript_14763/g.35160 Transcript_14763/m.35160 type:complete len:523 (-) Transcript_14763:175-1743(-)
MAPEVLRSERYGEAADVYSFGVVLWEVLTGEGPWADMHAMQVVGAVGFQGRTLPRPLSPDADPFLVDLCMKCMQHNPTKRPSFAAIVEALDAHFNHHSAAAVHFSIAHSDEMVLQEGRTQTRDSVVMSGRSESCGAETPRPVSEGLSTARTESNVSASTHGSGSLERGSSQESLPKLYGLFRAPSRDVQVSPAKADAACKSSPPAKSQSADGGEQGGNLTQAQEAFGSSHFCQLAGLGRQGSIASPFATAGPQSPAKGEPLAGHGYRQAAVGSPQDGSGCRRQRQPSIPSPFDQQQLPGSPELGPLETGQRLPGVGFAPQLRQPSIVSPFGTEEEQQRPMFGGCHGDGEAPDAGTGACDGTEPWKHRLCVGSLDRQDSLRGMMRLAGRGKRRAAQDAWQGPASTGGAREHFGSEGSSGGAEPPHSLPRVPDSVPAERACGGLVGRQPSSDRDGMASRESSLAAASSAQGSQAARTCWQDPLAWSSQQLWENWRSPFETPAGDTEMTEAFPPAGHGDGCGRDV